MPSTTYERLGVSTTVTETVNGRIFIAQDHGPLDDYEVEVVVFFTKESVAWLRKVLGVSTTPKEIEAIKHLRGGNPVIPAEELLAFASVGQAYTAGWRKGIDTALRALGKLEDTDS